MKKILSPYSDMVVFIIVPHSGVVPIYDQRRFKDCVIPYRKVSHIHTEAKYAEAVAEWLKSLRLKKKYSVFAITEKQFADRGRLPPTIKGTDFHATKKQLECEFEIG